jgi:VCBS repeat-containing protein
VFSTDVLTEGLVTTGKLSADLTKAGVNFSADSAVFVASAALSGIYISTDTAELFLSQAVNIAAASGRLSGEAAELAVTLAAAGVEISADSTVLIANAGRAGIELSEDAAQAFIDSSLAIAAECIESAKITERYVLMTVAEANQILKEASINAVKSSIEGSKKTYTFTVETASHLHSLGIDSVKYAKDLTMRAAQTTTKTISTTVHGANDAIVVVINTGSGLVVASLDSLTETVNNTTAKIK